MIGDPHFGHKAILKYRPQFRSREKHDAFIVNTWNAVVTKNDTVYCLGDFAFTMESLKTVRELNGRKILVRGNHDKLDTQAYLSVFKQVIGTIKYKDVWLSHFPVHPQELRGRFNIHGHVHTNTVPDPRYFNACVDNIGFAPMLYLDILDILVTNRDRTGGLTE